MANLYDILSSRAPVDPARTFAMLPDGRTYSYADVETWSARYANALVTCGVKAGDRVAVQAPKSIDMLLLYLGALRVGAVFLPLNPAYTTGELDYFLADAEPALFVRDRQEPAGSIRIETLDTHGDGTLTRLAAVQPDGFVTYPCDDETLAAILYTSGTTGRSKGAMLSHGNLASNALTLVDAWRFSSDDVLLHALPIFHTHGLFVATNVTLGAGAAMILLPSFDPADVLTRLPQASVLMGVPTFYIRLLSEAGLTRAAAGHVRLFISGSAPLSADVHREFRERTGHAILERYGMTETNMNTSNPYDGDRLAGTVGTPLPGVGIRIVDRVTGEVLPSGTVGEIEIAGPNVFTGYWRMPEKTAEAFRDGWFMSGDLGMVDEAGYLSIVGRAKDLIIAGGYNIYPAEVEAALDELAQVRESAVIGVPHPDLGEAVVAIVVPRDRDFSDAHLLVAALSDRLARFKQPRHIAFVEALPKNAMGKVEKTVLRSRYHAWPVSD